MFEKFVVHKVAEYPDETGLGDWRSICERIQSEEDQEHADEHALDQFWTVYGVLDTGMEDGLIDCEDEEKAAMYCKYFNQLLCKGRVYDEVRSLFGR